MPNCVNVKGVHTTGPEVGQRAGVSAGLVGAALGPAVEGVVLCDTQHTLGVAPQETQPGALEGLPLPPQQPVSCLAGGPR